MKFQEFAYVLPSCSSEQASAEALKVLELVSRQAEECLFYVMQPSNVLALAGLRVQSPYSEFQPSFDESSQAKLANLLESSGFKLQLEKSTDYTKEGTPFSIICEKAFKHLPTVYKSISDMWEEPNIYGDIAAFKQWSTNFELVINEKIQANILPETWAHDDWAAHNIRFGMLLGYPGQAISSMCWHEAERIKSGKDSETLVAQIPYQGLYCGAHVSYEYESELASNDIIRMHQKLWTDVLDNVYKVFSKSRLAESKSFMSEYEKFRQYDE